jgi:hypothetical protein
MFEKNSSQIRIYTPSLSNKILLGHPFKGKINKTQDIAIERSTVPVERKSIIY